MAFEFKGKLIIKEDTIQVSDTFKKRMIVLEQTEIVGDKTFTNPVKFQLKQDKCDLIDPYKLSDELTVQFNIRGNKWEKEGKTSYFTNLDIWKIEGERNSQPAPSFDNLEQPEDDPNDLPF